tara:strand:+ start:454 stop:711 length:258 start_codon:yes stop_codon:yes gene_type:complete
LDFLPWLRSRTTKIILTVSIEFTYLKAHWNWFVADGLLLFLDDDLFGHFRPIALVGIDTKNRTFNSLFVQNPNPFGDIGIHDMYI